MKAEPIVWMIKPGEIEGINSEGMLIYWVRLYMGFPECAVWSENTAGPQVGKLIARFKVKKR